MCYSGKSAHRWRDVRVVLLAVCAGALLAACKHDNMTTTNSDITKALWIANGTNVLEYVPAQLTGGVVAAVPHITNSSGAFGAPQGVTFDAAGNLWVMDPQAMVSGVATPALLEFSAAQVAALAKTASPEPVAIITSTSLAFPQQSVFDSKGNQWVSDHNNNTILVFTSAQLSMTGTNTLVPAVVISSAAFNGPLGIVFDSSGNLWVANNGGVPGTNNSMSATGTTIVEFAAASLPTPPSSGMLTPDLTPAITLSDDGSGSIQAPWELQFDSDGDLWSSNSATPDTLVEIAKASLAATGAPTPAITISPTTDMGTMTLSAPNGLCFDNLGDLASTSSVAPFSVPFYKAPLATGAIVPSTFIYYGASGTTLNAPAGCNFGPLVN
jgi:sugar lactone lactonase YvrE